ncbi:MAG: nitroreductase family protein [Halieaceae bacterium]|nr:nitroreductase family protein [Halieaceae bacterium]
MTELNNAEYVLTTTRSVRKRLDLERPVERAVVEECLDIALQAPNGSNLNTWKWVLVDDAATIGKIAELYNLAMDDFIASLGEATGDNYQGAHIPGFENIGDSVDYLRQHLAEVPVVAFPLLAGRTEGASVFYQASMWGSILQSVWSFFLALRSRGMGSAWTTAHLQREQEFAELLGIPAEYTQTGLFPVAYTLGTEFKKAWRVPVSEMASWNHFEFSTAGGDHA